MSKKHIRRLIRKILNDSLPFLLSINSEELIPLSYSLEREIDSLNGMRWLLANRYPEYHPTLGDIFKNIEIHSEEMRICFLELVSNYRTEVDQLIETTRVYFRQKLKETDADDTGYYNFRRTHDHDYLRRKTKRRQAARAKLRPKLPSFIEPEYEETSTYETLRISHRKGFGDSWRPTRERYWRPSNNNWKRYRKTQYAPL